VSVVVGVVSVVVGVVVIVSNRSVSSLQTYGSRPMASTVEAPSNLSGRTEDGSKGSEEVDRQRRGLR
jgi:hypothetical protein